MNGTYPCHQSDRLSPAGAQQRGFVSRLAYPGFVVPMAVAIFILRLLWRWVRGETPVRD